MNQNKFIQFVLELSKEKDEGKRKGVIDIIRLYHEYKETGIKVGGRWRLRYNEDRK